MPTARRCRNGRAIARRSSGRGRRTAHLTDAHLTDANLVRADLTDAYLTDVTDKGKAQECRVDGAASPAGG